MTGVTLGEIAQWVDGQLLSARPGIRARGLAIDSRKIRKGDLFVALPGERTDGHRFASEAIAAGACACLAQTPPDNLPAVRVKEPRKAMGILAAAYRARFSKLRTVAVTGSSGKTSTREMIAAVLGEKFSVLESRGNLNNDLGVPLTLARLEPRHQFAVLELGMNAPGEIRGLSRMVRPGVGVITNIGQAHVGRFSSQAALARAKLELLEELVAPAIAVLNRDDPFLARRASKIGGRCLTFGRHPQSGVRVVNSEVRWAGTRVTLEYAGKTATLCLKSLGRHQALNAAAAVAAGLANGLEFSAACRALDGFAPRAGMRMERRRIGKHRLLLDAYNSNPQSAAAALDVLAELSSTGRKIAVLGSMLELGAVSREAHAALGRRAVEAGVAGVIAVGAEAGVLADTVRELARRLRKEIWAEKVKHAEEALPRLLPRLSARGDLVLLKGSRGVGLEKMVGMWTRAKPAAR